MYKLEISFEDTWVDIEACYAEPVSHCPLVPSSQVKPGSWRIFLFIYIYNKKLFLPPLIFRWIQAGVGIFGFGSGSDQPDRILG